MNRQADAQSPASIEFAVTGEARLHCTGCEERVAKVLRQVSGVEAVRASAETQRVKVEFDPRHVQASEIQMTLERMGYEVEAVNGQAAGHEEYTSSPNARTETKPSAPESPQPANRRGDHRPRERRFDVRPLENSTNRASSDAASDHSADEAAGLEKLQVKIGGVECSFCVGTITKALTRMDGVDRVSVNMAHEEALIHYDPARVTPTDLKETLREIGYTVRDIGKERTLEEQEAELRAQRHNLFFAAAFAAIAFNFMALMWLELLAMGRAERFMDWLAPTLALSTMFGPGWRFLTMAWASLKRGILNQHVLMELSAWAALIGGFLGYVVQFPDSPFSRLLGVSYPVRYDFFGVVVFVNTYHILSAYVSLVVRTRASQAVRKLLDLVPPTARVVRDGREVEVPVEEVERGELVRVRPGESIPLDGVVVEGASGVDEHLVTGESIPQEKTVDDEVIGGSLVQAGTLLVHVTKVGAEGFVQQVARQVEESRALKPGVLILVDQVLKHFVPGVLGFAVAAFLIWTIGAAVFVGSPDWTRALLATLAVLVMGYPCALGMAAPLAMIRGGGMAAERGILMRSGEAFQILKEVRKVVLDKTGTITRGEPAVVESVAFGELDADEVIRLAASAESPSEHPLARAIVSAAEALELSIPPAGDFHAVAGKGIRATAEGHRLLVGKPGFLEEEHVDLAPAQSRLRTMQDAGHTVVALAADGRLAGLVAIADQVKPDAKEAIERMRQFGLEPVMLTGDNERTARAVAEQVAIHEYRAEVLPHDKAEAVRELQRQGFRVAMVGDGINDAPALMQADVGIAIGAGTDIAIESADVVLIGERLSAVVDAYEIGKKSYKKTVQNLILAFSFNGIGVPLATTGLVHPVWAMVAMAASVTTVLANSFGGRLLKSVTASEKKGHEQSSQHADRRRGRVGRAPARAGR
ncbi:MAG: heavy metal translocating P-type ATPase [Planctomycetes bacterium]|nr:heavy metal translocating P-type ATPase [Planctomycetia bacterium]MBI3468503.1 heavy metal translocating P-type ATPase [Planctomycetota bacterium]